MTDHEDLTASTPDDLPPIKAPITRYSRETLIGLRESPLVARLEAMPPLSAWFGEEYANTADKILNGSSQTCNTEKNSLSGSKSSFITSPFGGLKRTDENVASKHSASTRHRQQTDVLRGKDSRVPRGSPQIGEKSSARRERTERHHSELPSSRTRQNGNGRTTRGDDPRVMQQSKSERLPEWMDYKPDDLPDITRDSKTLEAWKSSMKQKEDDTAFMDDIDKLQSLASLRLESLQSQEQHQEQHQDQQVPSQQQPQQPQETQLKQTQETQLKQTQETQQPQQQPQQQQKQHTEVDPIFSQSQPSSGGSRFAKFFANKDQPQQQQLHSAPITQLHSPQHPSLQQHPQSQQQQYYPQQNLHPQQPRSISLSDLFQGDVHQPSAQAQQFPSQKPGMLFEEDILKSRGASMPAHRDQVPADNAGFDRVLQILSQSKPSVHSQLKNDTTHNHQQHQDRANRDVPSTISNEQKYGNVPPGLGPRQSLKNDTGSPSFKHKSINNLLPTSVMRQMSARSGSRSPSNSSVKSTGSGRQHPISPALSHHSPVAEKTNGLYTPQRPLQTEHPMAFDAYRDPNEFQSPFIPPSYRPPNGILGANGDDPRLARMQHPPFTSGMDPHFLPPHMMMPPDAAPMLHPHGFPPQFQGQHPYPMPHMLNNAAMQTQMFANNEQPHPGWNMRR